MLVCNAVPDVEVIDLDSQLDMRTPARDRSCRSLLLIGSTNE